MLPGPLAPLEPRKTRALTTIYAPRKHNPRKNRTAQTRMLDEVPVKHTLSPFHPLPAIGCKKREDIIVVDLKKPHDILKPLTPLRIHGCERQRTMDLRRVDNFNRQNTMDLDRPLQLVRENTYDVIKPIFLKAPKVKKRDSSVELPKKDSPKTRFKKAAMQVAKMTCYPETGKLLCLRERETFKLPEEDTRYLQSLPESPAHKLDKLTEIFQSLDVTGRHRDRMKKENSWF